MVLRCLAVLIACFSISLQGFGMHPEVAWVQQFSSAGSDSATSVYVDVHGNATLTGNTWGPVEDDSTNLRNLGFVARYDSAGNPLWAETFSSSTEALGHTVGTSVTVGELGETYVATQTLIPSDGDDPARKVASLRRYGGTGELDWVTQLALGGWETANQIATDGAGNVYVAGYGSESGNGLVQGTGAFLSKYNRNGELSWRRRLGRRDHDRLHGVALDSATDVVYVTGTIDTRSDATAGDAFVTKLDAAGSIVWHREVATPSNDAGHAVTVNSNGDIYMSGVSSFAFPGSDISPSRGFIAKFDPAGELQWVDPTSGPPSDLRISQSLSVDAHGDLILATDHFWGSDVERYHADGGLIWSQSLQHRRSTGHGQPADTDGAGGIYAVGETRHAVVDGKVTLGNATLTKLRDASGPSMPKSSPDRTMPAVYLRLESQRMAISSGLPTTGFQFDTYNLVLVNGLGDLTSAGFRLKGEFINSIDGWTFSDSAELPEVGQIGTIPESFFVLPEGTESHPLALGVFDEPGILSASFTLPGETPLFSLGESVVAVLSVPTGYDLHAALSGAWGNAAHQGQVVAIGFPTAAQLATVPEPGAFLISAICLLAATSRSTRCQAS